MAEEEPELGGKRAASEGRPYGSQIRRKERADGNLPLQNMLMRKRTLASDAGLGGSNNDVNAGSLDVQRIDGDGAGISTRRVGLFVDDKTDATRQRDGKVWGGDEDGLARSDQADDFGTAGNRSLAAATAGAGVRFHGIGGNQTAHQVQASNR